MNSTVSPVSTSPAPIAVGAIMPWAIFAGLLMLLSIYFVGVESGASIGADNFVHEYTHDGRHLLGFPCH